MEALQSILGFGTARTFSPFLEVPSHYGSMEDLCVASRKKRTWGMISTSDSCEALFHKHPHICSWDLILCPETFDQAIFRIHQLEIQVGSDADGRSTLTTSADGAVPPKQATELHLVNGAFRLQLWPRLANRAFHRVLVSLIGKVGRELKTGGHSCEFFLCGRLVGQEIEGPLELQVRWFHQQVWRSEALVFGDTAWETMTAMSTTPFATVQPL